MRRSLVALVGLALVVGSARAQEFRLKEKDADAPKAKPADAPKPKEKDAGTPKAAEAGLKDTKQQVSYGIGLGLARQLKGQVQQLELDQETLLRGIKDGLADAPKLTDQEIQQAFRVFQKEMAGKQKEAMEKRAAAAMSPDQKAQADKNKKEGESFLAANAKKPGVKTLPSGLQYKVIQEGTGKTPKESDTVVTNYRGTLIDGTEFDASANHGGPATFGVGDVIPGWIEALQLMKVGSKWQLYIPSDLAYGLRGSPPKIGPNSALVFDIELLDIK
jgi:FKBP-type peptidyl-prolyl cis-trans isomerase FklB